MQKLLENRKFDTLRNAEKLDKSIKIQEEKDVINEESKEESIKERTPGSSSVNFNNYNNTFENSSPIHSRNVSKNKDNAFHKLSQASQRPEIEKIENERIINLTEKLLIEENSEIKKESLITSLKSTTNHLVTQQREDSLMKQ